MRSWTRRYAANTMPRRRSRQITQIITNLSIANCISSFITISRYFRDNPENRFKN